MARNKAGRPEWFKFWRRNRKQLDIEQLSMESRGVVFTNMMRYFDGDDALFPMSDLEAVAFNVVKINVDDSFSEYAEREEINRENGKRGGRPPKTEANPNNPMGFEKTEKTRRKKTEDRSQKIEGRCGTEAAKPPRAARFTPPSLEEVAAYCQERGNGVDAQRFVDFYTANGWTQGRGKPIKDWRACVRTWEHGEEKKSTAPTPDLSWRQERTVPLDELVEYPPGSGLYRPRGEVNRDA